MKMFDPRTPDRFPIERSKAIAIARLLDGAALFARHKLVFIAAGAKLNVPVQETINCCGQYMPMAVGNRKKYVSPGYFGCGMARRATRPTTANMKPITIKVDRT